MLIKKGFFGFIFVCAILFTFNFCTSDNSTNPSEQDLKNYYPGLEGTSYKYEFKQEDPNGVIVTGTRSVNYGDEIYIDTVKYREQKDSLDDGNSITENISYFRKTPTGIFYFIDISDFLNLFPDSIKNLISTQDEMRLLLNPLASGSIWPVLRITVSLQPGVNFSPMDINGYFIAQEDLTLNLENGTVEVSAQKVKYDLDIVTDLNQTAQRFSAYAWFAEEIGMVKMKGNIVITNILLTGEINFTDTATTVTQDLIDYDIK
jgi:hypothetical protein